MPDGDARYDHMSDKSKGYAEGICAGWDEAAQAIEKITGGLLTLQDTKNIAEWREVARLLHRPKRK